MMVIKKYTNSKKKNIRNILPASQAKTAQIRIHPWIWLFSSSTLTIQQKPFSNGVITAYHAIMCENKLSANFRVYTGAYSR